jgi:membrane protein
VTSIPRRLDELQRRRAWLGFPVAVLYKFIDDHGVYLSVLITYYGFLALFPMMLFFTSLLGFVLDGQPELRAQILSTAVSQFPVIGGEISREGFGGSTAAVVIGMIVALWAAIRASQATMHMMNICWAVPRHQRPDPLRSPIQALPLIAIAGLMLLGTTIGTLLATSVYDGELRRLVPITVVTFSFLVAVLVFSLGMWLGTSYPLNFRDVLPGALVAAVGWLLLQRFGIAYANQIVSRAGDTYGVFAFVLGLMVFIFVAAQLVVLSVEVNVVRVKRLWPRALLGPFTTSVPLTEADVQSYRDATASTMIKDYQGVEVTFDHPAGPPATLEARLRKADDEVSDGSAASRGPEEGPLPRDGAAGRQAPPEE